MPAESKHEQIMAALATRLAGLTAGSTYHYTPSQVSRTLDFDAAAADMSQSYVILIRPGEERHEERSTGQGRAVAEVFLLLLKQHKAPLMQPPRAESAPTAWTVLDRCVRDVLVSLLADVTLGGLAENVVDGSLVIDRSQQAAGWAVAEVRFEVAYTYTLAAP